MTLPYAIFIILMGGSAINLTVRFGVKSNLASEGMQLFMLLCTNLGYFLGIGAGALVDKMPAAKWNFLISGFCSLIGFGGLIWTIHDEEFGVPIQILTSIFMVLAGFGAAIAYISSIVIVAKNFDSEVSILLVSILITYMKTANAFDSDVEKSVMPDGSGPYQMGMMGIISSFVYFGGMLFVHQVTLDPKHKDAIKKNDKTGVLIFVVIVSLYFLLYWIFDILLELKLVGLIIIVSIILVNFICSGISLLLGNKDFLLVGGSASSARAGPNQEVA